MALIFQRETSTLFSLTKEMISMTSRKQQQMPDFKQLNDRVIAEAPDGPFLGIRTNLDEPAVEAEEKHEQGVD
jgi:hypothetical protein